MLSRAVPAGVAHELRAEAGFGCAVCGCPILEYHHIVPWAERKHYDAKDMVALCRNHHHEIGKQKSSVAYAAKANPFNIRHRRFKGYLVTNKANQALVIGNTRIVNFKTAISYFRVPLFGYRIIDGEIRLRSYIPREDFFPEIEVIDNEIEAMIEGFWDIEFKSNYVKFRRRRGDVFLSMDFRKENVEIQGRFTTGGKNFEFSPTKCDFGGSRIENMTLQGNGEGSAINHGDGNLKLIRPNYAMMNPRAFLVDV